MYCVIVGGGKIGEYLARTLLGEGNEVAIIEEDPQTATYLSETLEGPALIIQGDGCEVARQEDAGVPQADIFVATAGQDEDNLAACEIASRVFGISRALARVNDPKNLRIFRRLGIESISSTALIARMIQEEAMLGSMSVAVTLTNDQVGLIDITVPPMRNHDAEEGVRAFDIDFSDGIRMVAVSHNDDIQVVRSSTRIYPGDQVIVAADTDLIDEARRVIRSL
jgi:trk system potassium uptake protein TrkA